MRPVPDICGGSHMAIQIEEGDLKDVIKVL